MDIRVPQIAEGVSSGTVVSILVKEGDAVKKNQAVVELETNKAIAGVQSPADGIVGKILVKEGDTAAVGSVLITLAGKGGGSAAVSAPTNNSQASVPAAPQSLPVSSSGSNYQAVTAGSASVFAPPASPSLRKSAREFGIDLTRVRGTENGGRITSADVRDYIQWLQQQAFSASQSAGVSVSATPAIIQPSIDFSQFGAVESKKLSSLRQAISRQMVRSWTTVPHVTQFADADITGIAELRRKYVKDYEKKGVRLTITSFLLATVVKLLKEFPEMNASIDEAKGEVVYKKYINLGIAVDTDQGLIVPVIKGADKMNLFEISQALQELAAKTRDRKVTADQMQGGSFTITNQGGIGGSHFTPIVNVPEVAILGLGQATNRAMVRGKKIESRLILPVALSYDHRLIDGGKAARFVKALDEILAGFDEKEVRLVTAKTKVQAKAPVKKKKVKVR